MVVLVVNNFSDGLKDYKSAFENFHEEILFLTTKKNELAYKDVFKNRIVFDDFYTENNLENFIIEFNKSNKINSIIATHEFDLEKIGKIRDNLKIKGQSEKSALEFRNKYLMKKKLVGITELPKFKLINNIEDLKNTQKEFKGSFVLKPLDSAGSVGVEIYNSFTKIQFNKISFPCLIEEYIPGNRMYHIDGLYHNGNILFSTVSEYVNGCLSFKEGNFVGSILLPTDNEICDRIKKETLSILQNLDTPNHTIPFHAEFFFFDNKIIFCEIASRVGGGKINEMIKEATGVDLFVESIRSILYNDYNFTDNVKINNQKYYSWILIPAKNGKLLSIGDCDIKGLEQFYKKENKIGCNFPGGTSSASEIVSAVLSSNSKENLLTLMNEFNDWAEVNVMWDLNVNNRL